MEAMSLEYQSLQSHPHTKYQLTTQDKRIVQIVILQ